MSDPQQPGQPDPVTLTAVLDALNATVDELTATKGEVKALKGEAGYLRKYGRVNRLRIGVVAAGLVVDIAASAVAGYALAALHSQQVQARHNAATITQLRDNNLDACQAGNGRLIKQEKALDAILGQVPPRNATERAIVTKDEGFIRDGWNPRDCARIYPLPPGH